MKILYVVNNAAFFCSHRLPVALAASRVGHEVHLVTGQAGSQALEDAARAELARAGIPHRALGFTSGGTHPWHEARGLWQLLGHVRRLRPDLVHCASPKGLLYGGLAARWAGVPALVLAVSGMGSLFIGRGTRRQRLLRRLYLGLARLAYAHPRRRVIVQNQDDRQALVQAGLVGAAELVLIPGSGVKLDAYLGLPLEGRPPLVVLPARLLRDKGVLEFVAAARELRAQRPQWRFALVGVADYANPSAVGREQVLEWENAGLIEWWGHREDMAEVFGQARIVCLPSYREGMPKALLEAAAAGCAVVTTDAVGCREAVLPGQSGDLVPVRDAAALTATLRRLIDDPQRCLRYGAAGRELARQRFDIDAVIRQTLNTYDELAR